MGRLAVVVLLALTAVGCGGKEVTYEQNEGDPSLSRDGKWLAFTRDGAVYVATRGEAAKRITDPGENIDVELDVSPDGSRVAFIRTAGEVGVTTPTGMYVVNSDGSGLRRLTKRYGSSPAWSPDGKTIAFSREGIVLIDADGENERRLLRIGEDPAWSPDGSKIAFARYSGSEIVSYDLKTKRIQRVTRSKDGGYAAPAWSPDGTQIAFMDWGHFRSETAYELGIPEIYVVNVDGTGQQRLTRNKEWDTKPTWTRHGRIVFTSYRDGPSERIYVMNRDGTGVRRFR